MKIDSRDIENMQGKVKLIRQTLAISMNDFASLLGVSRQTVYNIENKKKALTQTQFLAISALIDMALKEQPEKKNIIAAITASDCKWCDNDSLQEM